jgi:hypothetical protein
MAAGDCGYCLPETKGKELDPVNDASQDFQHPSARPASP